MVSRGLQEGILKHALSGYERPAAWHVYPVQRSSWYPAPYLTAASRSATSARTRGINSRPYASASASGS